MLPLAVRSRILLHSHAGELAEGQGLIAEAQAVADATGSRLGPYGAIGVAAERGRHELLATGERVRRRTVETLVELTTQEAHIARLAVDGRSPARSPSGRVGIRRSPAGGAG